MYKSTNNSSAWPTLHHVDPAKDFVMRNYFVNYQETNSKHTEQDATEVDHYIPNVNNILGNSKRDTEDIHMLVTPGCHQKWINIDNDSVFNNPKQCLHT